MKYTLDFLYYGQHQDYSAESAAEMKQFLFSEIASEGGSVYGAIPVCLVQHGRGENRGVLAERGKETSQDKIIQSFAEALS